MANRFIVLGIHDKDVLTVAGNVARVRMYIGDKEVDEDFNLPDLSPAFPKTVEVYSEMLKSEIEARMIELEGSI